MAIATVCIITLTTMPWSRVFRSEDHYRLGITYAMAGELPAALGEFSQAYKLKKDIRHGLQMVIIYSWQREHLKALDMAQRLRKANPDIPVLYTVEEKILERLGLADQAIQRRAEQMDRFPDYQPEYVIRDAVTYYITLRQNRNPFIPLKQIGENSPIP